MTLFRDHIDTAAAGRVRGAGWPTVLRWAALAGIAEAALVMVYVERAPVPPAFLLAVLLLVGVVLMGRSKRSGIWVTTIASVLLVIASVVMNAAQLGVAASFGSFAVNWVAALTGVLGVVAGIASWRDRPRSASASNLLLGAVGLAVVIIVVVGIVASLTFADARRAPGDVVVDARNSKFHPSTLTASGGSVTFFLDNRDNTLHDFHILGVKEGEEDLPANHQVGLTVRLAPGTYKYRCDLHSGMSGTLIVR